MEERTQPMRMAFGILHGKMRTMSFMPELKAYLKDNGFIYTVRKYEMTDTMVEVEGIGECHRMPLGRISSKEALDSYWNHSGFISLELWWDKIRQFIPNIKEPMYLYKVEVKSE